MISAWNQSFPQCSWKGTKNLPRVARTLKGWHRRCPARSQEQVKSLERIQMRGRMRQLKSVMRYEKAGKIAAEVMKLNVPMRRYAVEVAAGLKNLLTGRRAFPILPFVEFR